MCKRCGAKRDKRATPLAVTYVGDLRYIVARCTNCSERMVTITGVALPLATGDFYSLHEIDLAQWIRGGFVFEFKNVNDAVYLQEKYSL